MAAALGGCSDGELHFSRVHKKLDHIVFIKLPNAVGAEFDLLILENHIRAAVRIEEFGAGDFKPAHIKVARLHGNMYFRIFLDITLGIFHFCRRFQAGRSLKVIRCLESRPTGINRNIASQKATVDDPKFGENRLVSVFRVVQQVLDSYVIIP